MNSETKTCQNCKNQFTIEPEDFEFYEKIKVPAPTWCPDCRMKRRMVWRNEISLYKRPCDSCGKSIISIYNSDASCIVYCQDCWWSDKWDPMVSGREFNFNKTFFEQFVWLLQKIPAMNLFYGGNKVNSDFCNYASNVKNCYLFIAGKDGENLLYTNRVSFSKDTADIFIGNNLELSYEDVQCNKSYKLLFSKFCGNCSDSAFLYDCKNCSNCFGCANLRNKQYYIFNQSYSKEEYLEKIKEFDLGSYKGLQEAIFKFKNIYKEAIHKYAHLVNTINSTGDNLFNAKNCKNCFEINGTDSENCKFTYYVVVGVKDSYDNVGMSKAEKIYETIAIGFESNENSDYYFSYFIKGSSRIYYSYNCISCHDLFACIGLRNKQYCILNKQYTKEEYEQLVPKIIEHMNSMPYIDKKGRVYKYGEFFPPELSPFSYNETIAQEYFPLTKEQAEQQGYSWKDPEERNITITIKSEDLPDHIKDVKDDILTQVIECQHNNQNCNEQCTTAFKIIPQELEFYKKMNLPLPRLCPNCRHYQRIKQRNPLKLWKRTCQCQGQTGNNSNNPNIYQNTITHTHGTEPCPNEFETTYAPERKEIVYCEQCYQQEVA